MELSEIEQLLMDIGLTKQEARCYLALYKLKEAQTGELSKESNIATANIYPVLSSLIKKGLVSYRVQNNIKTFFANPPDSFNEFVKNKQEQLDRQKEKVKETISQLKQAGITKETQSNYKYYEGISGIKGMWYEIINELPKIDKTNLLKIYTSRPGSYQTLFGFYDEFHKERVKQKIGYRLILDPKMKEHGLKRSKTYNTQVKYSKLSTETEWGVLGNMTFMYYLSGKKPVCFLIKDEKIAKTYEEVFDRIWTTAKKG